MHVTTIGVDLAKRVFAVHGVDHHGKAVLRKTLRREQMVPFFTRLPSCMVAMEACGSAHYWARTLASLGHTVKLIAPQFVKPYVKGNKTARIVWAMLAHGREFRPDFSAAIDREARPV